MSVYVFGAGGHAKVMIAALTTAGTSVLGVFDDDDGKRGHVLLGVEVIGAIGEAARMGDRVGIVAIGDNRARKDVVERLAKWSWTSVVHPRAWIHPSVEVGPGVFVTAGAVIQPDARLGAHCIVNTGATVDHDCVIGEYVHLAPGVHLGGGVVVEEGALLGVGAVALPDVRIGAWTIVGAGSVVTGDLPAGVTAVGAPARVVGPAQA